MRLHYINLFEAVEHLDKHIKQATALARELGNLNIPADVEGLLVNAYEADPSPKKSNVTWILKQAKPDPTTGTRHIILPEDGLRVKNALELLTKLKSKVKAAGKPLDINQYNTILDLEQTLEGITGVTVDQIKSQGLNFDPNTYPGVSIYAQSGPYVILRVTDANSLAKLGDPGLPAPDGTRWCTRASYGVKNMSKIYLHDPTLMVPSI